MHFPPRKQARIRVAVWLALSGSSTLVAAQAAPPATTPAATPATTPSLAPVTVSASALALGSGDMSTPVTILEGDDLVLRRAATLGETLAGEPGISASHFGAGASRPVIRGMDGARVKVLSDGAEVQDASTISPDHAVGVEPMLSRQIEVLRGPSALAYGGGAVGGVVNVLDGKVPTAMPPRGYEGSVEFRAGSAARDSATAFEVTGGAGPLVLHAEGVQRKAGDYRVGGGWTGGGRVAGSFNDTDTGSVGLSWVGGRGYLGLAYTRQRNTYGLPGHQHGFEGCHAHGDRLHCGAHDDAEEGHADEDESAHGEGVPVVRLRSERWDLRGELRDPLPGFTRLRLRAGVTDYRHDEIEGGAVATTFLNKAQDGRLELEHVPLWGWRGVIGLQGSQRDFSAQGEEAYVQPTTGGKEAVFVVEEYKTGDWRFEAGLRHERQRIRAESSGDRARHSGNSASLGAVWKFAPEYSLGASLTQAARLPTAEELYADGLHLATATYERGNPGLGRETSRNVDLTLRKFAGATTFSLSAFRNRIGNYIYARTLDQQDGLQLVDYTQRNVNFTGVEGQVRHRLDAVWGVTVSGDWVQARLDGGGNLPRIPAKRLGVKLDARWNAWQAEAELVRTARQDRIAAFETATPGYTLLNLSASYTARLGAQDWLFYARATNLGDRLAFAHTSFIKDAAPLAGRNVVVGAKMSF